MARASESQIRIVLEQYGLGGASLMVLRDLGNTVLRADVGSRPYSLRVCTPSVTRDRLERELDWLEAIRRDTALIVPKVVLNTSGERITAIEDRLAVAFGWLDGQHVADHMNLETARSIGRLTATLHEHAITDRPKNVAGSRYDSVWLNGPNSWWTTRARDDLKDDYPSLESAAAFSATTMDRLGTARDHFGLIHSDLNFWNILWHDEQFAVIDFEACGMGHFLLDLGVTEIEFLDYENGPDLVAAFRASYSTARHLSLEPSDLAAFRVAACVMYLEWLFTIPDAVVRSEKLRWVPRTLHLMREALAEYA